MARLRDAIQGATGKPLFGQPLKMLEEALALEPDVRDLLAEAELAGVGEHPMVVAARLVHLARTGQTLPRGGAAASPPAAAAAMGPVVPPPFERDDGPPIDYEANRERLRRVRMATPTGGGGGGS